MKTLRFAQGSGLVLLVGLAMGACAKHDRPMSAPSASDQTRSTPSGNESAVASITQARCDRESRCDNVGSGRKYESMSACATKTRADWRDDLNARECPQGIVPGPLHSCVKQIKEESCGNPVEKLESVLACRTVDLCQRG
jgi:hypothetical protein